jgi:hypothetical protein
MLGVPFPIDNDLFKGQGMLRVRGSTPGADSYFQGSHLTGGTHAGKKMQSSFVVSGNFKRELSFAELYTGM